METKEIFCVNFRLKAGIGVEFTTYTKAKWWKK